VNLDAKGFRQVLINLIRNAADALPETGGRIQIRIKRDGDRAYLHVADNGRGIPEEIQARIYEPFFTTKGERGLGLGLDISKKIIEAHQGELDFRSVPGKGTTFRVSFPVL
jgi:signal transduction histidine kinase